MKKRFFILLLLAANISHTFADETNRNTIFVTAPRIVQEEESSWSVSKKKPHHTDITDVLSEFPQLRVEPSSGPSGPATPFFRGLSPGHTLVIVDELELNDPGSPDGAADLQSVGLSEVSSLQLIDGPRRLLFGPEAAVIKVDTHGKQDDTWSLKFGSYDTQEVSARASSKGSGKSQTAFQASFSQALYPSIAEGAPEKDKSQKGSLSLAQERKFERAKLSFSMRGSWEERDLDDMGSVAPIDNPSRLLKREVIMGQASLELPVNRIVLTPKLGYIQTKKLDKGGLLAGSPLTYQNDAQNIKAQLFAKYPLAKGQLIESSIEIKRERDLSPGRNTQEGDTFGLGIVHEWNVELYKIGSGVRIERSMQEQLLPSWHIDVKRFFTKSLTTELSLFQSTRSPSLNQLYDSVYGEPQLKAEEVRGLAFKAGWHKGIFNTSLSAHGSQLRERLTYHPVTYKNMNGGGYDFMGLTWVQALRPLPFIKLKTSLEKQWIRNIEGSVPLRRPATRWRAEADFSPFEGLKTTIKHSYVSERQDFAATLSSYHLTDLSLAFETTEDTTYALSAKNIFNHAHPEAYGTSWIGRSFYLEGRWKL